jgi:hypothetical protein
MGHHSRANEFYKRQGSREIKDIDFSVPPPKRKVLTCRKTVNYPTEEEAASVSEAYNKRVLFAEMNAYFCRRHQCWHIGHRNKQNKHNDREYY